MKLYWNFQRGGGLQKKSLPWGRYGYFLELLNSQWAFFSKRNSLRCNSHNSLCLHPLQVLNKLLIWNALGNNANLPRVFHSFWKSQGSIENSCWQNLNILSNHSQHFLTTSNFTIVPSYPIKKFLSNSIPQLLCMPIRKILKATFFI